MKKPHVMSLLLSIAVTILLCPLAFAGTPQALRVSPRAAHVALLKPFGSSVYGASRRSVVFRLASILSRTRVYSLTLGSPDATAALIEDIVENS